MSTVDLTKFINLSGLSRFWENVKNYVDLADTALANRATALENTVNGYTDAEGTEVEGLVKKVADLRNDVDALGGVDGGIQGMIDASIEELVGEYADGETPATGLRAEIAAAQDAAEKHADDAADAALADAKEYVDGIVNDTTAEDGSTVKGLNSKIADLDTKIDGVAEDAADALDAHVNAQYENADGTKASIHLAAGEREAWNQAKADIDAFLSDNDLTQDVVDTLTNIQDYIKSDLEAADEMVKKIGALETTVGAPATEDAEATGLYKMIADSADGALNDAKKEIEEALKSYYTKEEVDGLIGKAAEGENPATGLRAEIATAESNAKIYTDNRFDEIQFVSNEEIDGIFAPAQSE